jgi:hypothetical protein
VLAIGGGGGGVGLSEADEAVDGVAGKLMLVDEVAVGLGA